MKNVLIILVLMIAVSCTTSAQVKKQKTSKKEMTKKIEKIVKTEAEWKASLTPQEYLCFTRKRY